jgi:type IV pilus assembly protein PilA
LKKLMKNIFSFKEVKNMKNNKKKGFTLIELIVVIAILGILAAIAVPRFAGTQTRAQERVHNQNRQTLISAAQMAVAEHGAPTATVTWATANAGTGNYLWANYMQAWPTNPLPAAHAQTGTYTVEIAATTGVVTVTPAAAP